VATKSYLFGKHLPSVGEFIQRFTVLAWSASGRHFLFLFWITQTKPPHLADRMSATTVYWVLSIGWTEGRMIASAQSFN